MAERRDTPEPAAPDRVDDTPESDEERLFDAYLDAALRGGAVPDPSSFLPDDGRAGGVLKDRLDALRQAAERGRAARRTGGVPRAPAAAAPVEAGLPFERLGEFRLLRRLGEGGMGAVFLAEQESLGRIVALKVLRPELRGSPTADARFEREALAAARLDHPHIVQVLAVGEERGVRFVAMAYVEGRGLDEILDEAARDARPVPAADVLRWGAQIARALACAHAASIVHRDVKPSNLRITPDGRAMLLDFGIARALDAPALTMTGPFVGTPQYAAPEQLSGGDAVVDGRTDTYALGVTLYECLSLRAPFAGRTAEQILHQVMQGAPPPLRRVAPATSRDLEVVVAKAMARRPADRYASASDLADDLEAVTSFRPIRARPPAPLRRLAHWARRRPGFAAMAATGAVAALAGVALAVVQARAADEQRRSDARRAVADADGRIAAWRRAREESAALEREVRELSDRLRSEYLSDEEVARLDRQEDAAAGLRRRREAAYYEVLDLLRRAEQLDPEVEGTAATLASLHLERWREAAARHDREATAFHRDLTLRTDPDGAAAREIRGAGVRTLVTGIDDAVAYVFRYADLREFAPGGGPRFVPVAVQAGPQAVAPGTVVLEVVGDAAPLARGDLVVEMDGRRVADLAPLDAEAVARRGVADALVHSDGALVRRALPAGIRVRATAAPLALSPACRLGPGPAIDVAVEPGEYVVLVRAPGREDQRVFLPITEAVRSRVAVTLAPAGSSPAGFVRIEAVPGAPTFWIQEREVSVAEYREFLNDPRTLAEIAAAKAPIRFPRDAANALEGGYWRRGSDGAFALPDDAPADGPVYGIARDDARAYARWFGERIGARARGVDVRLPTRTEWVSAAGASVHRRFPYGDTFRPRWAKSCFSRKEPGFESSRTYVVDESPFAVHDLSGSVSEWTDDESRGFGQLCGGSWGAGRPDDFGTWYSLLVPPDKGYTVAGFRLVAVPAAAAAAAVDAR